MVKGKHIQKSIRDLEKTIEAKDKEIFEVKISVADILKEIKEINESNDYGDPSVKRRKISELCDDTRYELLIDEEEPKKIELS